MPVGKRVSIHDDAPNEVFGALVPIYGTLVTSFIALQHYVSNHDVVIISTLVFGFFARLLALRLKLGLPVFYYSHEGH